MAALTIRNIDPMIKDKLRRAAAAHGRSMEEEVRTILRNALAQSAPASGLGGRVHARFAALGGAELPLPERHDAPRATNLDDAATA